MHELNRVPLRALRAVEAVFGRRTVVAAAEELGITPGAVSQQVARAEAALGLALFDRGPKGMAPTPRGQEISGLLSAGFAQLSAAVARSERARDDSSRAARNRPVAGAGRPASDHLACLDAAESPAMAGMARRRHRRASRWEPSRGAA